MQRFFRFLILFALMAGASGVWAAEAPHGFYIDASRLPPQLLPPPPVEGSDAWRSQIMQVIETQKDVSADDLTGLRDEQHLRLSLMSEVIPGLTRDKVPTVYGLLERVLADSEAISGNDKRYWHTRRPYLTDQRVHLLVDPIDQSPAYPSGHTCDTAVLAEVMGMIYPEHLSALRQRAAAIARHRVEGGVHYPVDLEAGNSLAMLITGALLNNNDFQRDLRAAQGEIARQP